MIIRTSCAFLMILFFTSLAMPVFAQDQPPSAEDIVAKMQSKLNLTQDQVTAVTPIIDKYWSKRNDLLKNLKNGTVKINAFHAQMNQLAEGQKQEFSQILSAAQLSQWEIIFNQRIQANGGGKNTLS